jgi:hypothetical protein
MIKKNKLLSASAILVAASVSTGSVADDPTLSPPDMPWFLKIHTQNNAGALSLLPFQRDSNQQQVMAYGTHQCQSQTSIGHTCQVSSLVTDCAEAYAVLKRQDCCGSTKEGGVSIGFTLGNCGAYAQPQH